MLAFSVLAYAEEITQSTANKCDNTILTEKLSEFINTNLYPDNKLVSESIVISSTSKPALSKLVCRAEITLTHVIYPESLVFSYKYKVPESNNVDLITWKKFPIEQRKQFKQWKNTISSIISYQKTKFGSLYIMQHNSNNRKSSYQNLYLGNLAIQLDTKSKFSTITIDRKYLLNSQEIFLLSAYYNSPVDKNIDHNYLIKLNSESSITITPAFSYAKITSSKNELNIYSEDNLGKIMKMPRYKYLNGKFIALF